MPRIVLDTTRNLDSSDILEILLENGVCACERCDELERQENTSTVRTSEYGRNANYETWCEDCTDNNAYLCDCCGDRVTEDCCERGDNVTVCRGCYENEYFYCEGCNDIYHTDYMGDCENGCYCNGCTPEDDEDEDEDEERPATLRNFVGDGMGQYHSDCIRSSWNIPNGAVSVEIELTTKHRNRVANMLRSLYGCACERDGSLDDAKGMEIVTKPQTYPKIMETLKDMLGSIQTMGCALAWNNGKGYGIHVNLDARQWDETKRAAYCAQFGVSNRRWLELVAGREQNHWANYKSDDGETVETSKYSACGIKSGGRMEVRIFRSTLKTETAIGYVALCKDMERFVDCDLFRRPKDLLFWLVRNGSKETRWLLGSKIPGQILSALLPPKSFESFLLDAGIEIGQN